MWEEKGAVNPPCSWGRLWGLLTTVRTTYLCAEMWSSDAKRMRQVRQPLDHDSRWIEFIQEDKIVPYENGVR
jgi:hypothetical protein